MRVALSSGAKGYWHLCRFLCLKFVKKNGSDEIVIENMIEHHLAMRNSMEFVICSIIGCCRHSNNPNKKLKSKSNSMNSLFTLFKMLIMISIYHAALFRWVHHIASGKSVKQSFKWLKMFMINKCYHWLHAEQSHSTLKFANNRHSAHTNSFQKSMKFKNRNRIAC